MASQEKAYWEGKAFSFFCNKACEYYPCHPLEEGEELNCLFCYCPLYMLGRDCGGNFTYTEKGIKDCSHCKVPHRRENYGYIAQKFRDIAEAMARREREQAAEGERQA